MPLNISVSQHWHDPQTEVSVKSVQRRLIARGYYCGPTAADGWFRGADDPDGSESNTLRALKRFQAFNGLAKDGVVGPLTWGKLKVSTTTVHPAATATSAQAMADFTARWLTTGLDGSRPVYVFGAEINLAGDSSPDRTDCSEAMQYGVYHQVHDSWVDGSHNQWAACHHITVAQALRTKGALVFQSGSGSPNGIHHVGMSLGDGSVAQARSRYPQPGELSSGRPQTCGIWKGQHWDYAGLIPVLRYS